MFDVKNKVVFITGGSNGIGAKVIEYLLEEDVKHVTNLDLDEDAGLALEKRMNVKYGEDKVKFIKGDVTNDDDLFSAYETILQEQGYVDIVINNAGILNDSKEKYKKEIEINLTAVTANTFKAIEVMRKDEGGKGGIVLNVGSVAALCQSTRFPVYNATKSAVLQFSNCIGALDNYTRTGVSVIALCVGITDTSLVTKEKIGHFYKEIDDDFMSAITAYYSQKAESAARAVVEVIKRGESGSTWLSIADESAEDITNTVKKAYGIMSEIISSRNKK